MRRDRHAATVADARGRVVRCDPMGSRRRRTPDPDAASAASEARTAAAMTSRELGDALGLDAGHVRSVESGHRTMPPRAAVLLADVLGLSIVEAAGLASPEVRIDAADADPLAREVAVLLGAAWEALRRPDAAGRRALAVMRWVLSGSAGAREPGVYVAAVALTSGGRSVRAGEVIDLSSATASGIAAELAAGRVAFVPSAVIATAGVHASTSTAAPR